MSAPSPELSQPPSREVAAADAVPCVSLDLEVTRETRRIRELAAVRGDSPRRVVASGAEVAGALDRLDELAEGAAFLLGHNLVDHDLPILRAHRPNLRILALPAVDTLRLNPLAFPRNPYHRLVKHYKEAGLVRCQRSDPELDAGLALQLFRDQRAALAGTAARAPELVTAWHGLTTEATDQGGLTAVWAQLRGAARPEDDEAKAAIARFLAGRGCATHTDALLAAYDHPEERWPLAFALAWISVAGDRSVVPPWVRHRFPGAGRWIRRLRDQACGATSCSFCRSRHDAQSELARWFGFPAFRPEPADAEGNPLQEVIVQAAMAGEHVLGILPTGTGKSVCYQVPALSRYEKTGALTVVISPLVALMADQVKGLEARSITCAAALNGLLSLPERGDVLERIRLGDVGILLIAPEQLRSMGCRRALQQREIGAWVLDEAHCLSKWGHDFRPDYRYVGRFIREHAGDDPCPSILCLTATAKPDVVEDIRTYFRETLGFDLRVLDGGAKRENLEFEVRPTSAAHKLHDVALLLEEVLVPEASGGAIVYCATRRRTEEVAEFLATRGLAAAAFHAGLQPERKKETQQGFVEGRLQVIAATNAFGMGIDKPDVRLVVHADVPGSLENYLQEAGRAGRDRRTARCVLLYSDDDVERQFGMSARSRLDKKEIHGVLKALRRLAPRHGLEVVATSGEILAEDRDASFERDSATDDTRVRTAVAWLEEAKLLEREHNETCVYPSSLRVTTLAEAEQRIMARVQLEPQRRLLLRMVEALLNADALDGISTDDLMARTGRGSADVRRALHELETLGIASNDTSLTAGVHLGVARSSGKRLQEAIELESAVITTLRAEAPDLAKGESSTLSLRALSDRLRGERWKQPLQDRIARLLRSLAQDGRHEGGPGSLALRSLGDERIGVTLLREWADLDQTASLRRDAASVLLRHLLSRAPEGSRGADLLVSTTHGELRRTLEEDLAVRARAHDVVRLLERALLWLHEQEVVRLHKGLAVFRSAMTIRLREGRRGFTKADYQPLQAHYGEQVVQIHVMAEYAARGMQVMTEALRLAMDYFALERDAFVGRWLGHKKKELARQTTPGSWRRIVEELKNSTQQQIVVDDREETNVLVLAGPGSGKTRVLVHRIAYLIRVRREDPRAIIALAYNRHAAVEIRRRLDALIGQDARGVLVLTHHALALRLVGRTLKERAREATEADFDQVIEEAVAVLRGQGLSPEEADEQRDRLLGGFRWILVDEYQDILPGQYELLSALAGRKRAGEEERISLFALGDDDQNVYAFSGASVEHIRRFEADWAARPTYLVENYRSTAHIIAAANAVIEPASQRMKEGHPITVDSSRRAPPGGAWTERDPLARGRVQVLHVAADPLVQAASAMEELTRLSRLDAAWDWARVAVIGRGWRELAPVRSWCEHHDVRAEMANDGVIPLWRLRETRALLAHLEGLRPRVVRRELLDRWLDAQAPGEWIDLLREAAGDFSLEAGDAEVPLAQWREHLVDWGRSARRRQRGLLLLTAHRAKGLEFDHVAVLDGAWLRVSANEDRDAPRRLYYVAMTRARHTLTLLRAVGGPSLAAGLGAHPAVLEREGPRVDVSASALRQRWERSGLEAVDLSFAGRHGPTHPVHGAIAALRPGDPLAVERVGERVELETQGGVRVGRFAGKYGAELGEVLSARVAAVIEWRREDSKPEFQGSLRCERWETVIPELCLA